VKFQSEIRTWHGFRLPRRDWVGWNPAADWQSNAARFSSSENSETTVGRTPRSARVPLDPLLAARSISSKLEGRSGAGRGPGGPPHNSLRPTVMGKTSGIGLAIGPSGSCTHLQEGRLGRARRKPSASAAGCAARRTTSSMARFSPSTSCSRADLVCKVVRLLEGAHVDLRMLIEVVIE
jgi:hypothetical protein